MQLHLAIASMPVAQPVVREIKAAPTRDIQPRRLPELYYLQNFRSALASLEVRYSGLLGNGEAHFIRHFAALPEVSQCLLTRLVMRKGSIFKRTTINYPEVGEVQLALRPLTDLGWIDIDPQVTIVELFQILDRTEWRNIFGSIARRAVDDCTQLPLPIGIEPSVPRSLSLWHRRLTSTCLRVSIEPIAKRLQLLYFGNDRQTWAEFVLTDLGLQKYEQVPHGPASCAFTSRAEIEHFYRLNDCRARIREGEPAPSIVNHCCTPAGIPAWLQARFARLHLRLGDQLNLDGQHELALRAFRDSATTEGRISIIRLLERRGLLSSAVEEAASALQGECREGEREAIARTLHRLRRRLGEKVGAEVPRSRPQVFELTMAQLRDHERVERRVCSTLSTDERPTFYVENNLFPSLLGLLCWDAIFAPIPGAFFHPFQSGPADLFTREFRPRRVKLIDAQLALLDSGQHEEIIWRHYREKAGISSCFVRWGKLKPKVLELALLCIPPTHLKLIFERMLDDLASNCSGLPDLIHFIPDERRYQLIEVKAPGDRVQHNQRRWLEFFAARGIPATVCSVKWTASGPTHTA